MSGLEILGAFASSVAVVQAVQGTIKIINALRDVGEIQKECDELKDEIALIHIFCLEAQTLAKPMPHEPSASNEHPLIELTAEKLKEIEKELNDWFNKCTKDCGGDVRKVRKWRWIKEKGTIDTLRTKSQRARKNLETAVNFRNSFKLNSVETNQELLIELLLPVNLSRQEIRSINDKKYSESLKLIAEPTINNDYDKTNVALGSMKPHHRLARLPRPHRRTKVVQEDTLMTVTGIQPVILGRKDCSRHCKCRCHWNEQKYQASSWVQPLLGSWMVGFRRVRRSGCSEPECQGSGDVGMQFQYQLPHWLWAGMISFRASYDGQPNIGWSLRPSKIVPINEGAYSDILNPLSLYKKASYGLDFFPNDCFETGEGFMERMIQQDAYESVRILLQAWINILPKQGLPRRVRYQVQFTLSYRKLTEEHIQILQKVQEYAFLDQDEQDQRSTRVHDAVREGDSALVQVLQDDDQRWAIDELDDMGDPPIHLAIQLNAVEEVKLLVAAGADVNKLDWEGLTPLMLAAINSRVECVRVLLEANECRRQINRQSPKDGKTSLHYAVEFASPDVVALLLEAGASVKARDKWGTTPLHQLAPSQQDAQDATEIVRLLRSSHADLNAVDDMGFTPTLWSISKSNMAALRALVDAGASLQNITNESCNILDYAAWNANFDVLNFLADLDLTGSVDPTLQNVYRATPWDVFLDAMQLQDWEIAGTVRRPNLDEQHAFAQLFYQLLANHLESDISTLEKLKSAAEQRNSEIAHSVLSGLIKKKELCHRQDLVQWYRGIQGYITDQGWDLAIEDIQSDIDDMTERLNYANAILDGSESPFYQEYESDSESEVEVSSDEQGCEYKSDVASDEEGGNQPGWEPTSGEEESESECEMGFFSDERDHGYESEVASDEEERNQSKSEPNSGDEDVAI